METDGGELTLAGFTSLVYSSTEVLFGPYARRFLSLAFGVGQPI